MKVLEKFTMPNGVEVQLEDWREHNKPKYPTLYGFTIAAYPVALRTGKYRWVEAGDKFRLQISHNPYTGYTEEKVLADYEALKHGEKSLEDLSDHFYNSSISRSRSLQARCRFVKSVSAALARST